MLRCKGLTNWLLNSQFFSYKWMKFMQKFCPKNADISNHNCITNNIKVDDFQSFLITPLFCSFDSIVI